MNCDEFSSIPDWIIEHPECAAIFDEFGLDTSCGGKSLRYVCSQKDIAPGGVLERLSKVIEAGSDARNETGG